MSEMGKNMWDIVVKEGIFMRYLIQRQGKNMFDIYVEDRVRTCQMSS